MKNNCIHKINSTTNQGNTFILLSAGINKTRGERGCKSLIRQDKDLAIDKQIRIIRRFDKTSEIIIVGGYDFESLRKYVNGKYPEIRIIENQIFDRTTSLESLRLGMNACVPSNIYTLHGDRIFNTECISNPTNFIYVSKQVKRASPTSVGLNELNGSLLNMSYGLEHEWCQNLFIPYHLVDHVKSKISTLDKNINIFELINKINEESGVFVHYNSKISSIEIKQK